MFSVGSCISFGWETFKKRPWFLIGNILLASVLYGLVSGIINSILVATLGSTGLPSLFESLVRFVFQVFLGMGMIAFTLKAHDDVASVKFSDFWHPQPFWNYAGTSILLFIIVVIGLVLLIVPGIIAITMLMFAGYLVVDRNVGPIKALKESARITKGHRLDLFLLILAILGITLLGLICLIVGIFVAAPITMLAAVHAYRMLSKMAPDVAA